MCTMSLVPMLPAVSQSLVDALSKKDARGEVSAVPELWRRLVFRELDWCSKHFDELSPRHRSNAATLVDWYHRHNGYTPERWLKFYRSPIEMYRRQAVAELCWCSSNVDALTRRHRIRAIHLLCDVEQYAPELYQDVWRVLLDSPWHD